MTEKEYEHSWDILFAYDEGKKLEFHLDEKSAAWFDSVITDRMKLHSYLFDLGFGDKFRIKLEQEPFKVIVDELYKFKDNNFHVDENFKIHLDHRKKCEQAFNDGKIVQYKHLGNWVDFSLDNVPQIGTGLTYITFYIYEKLFGNNSIYTESDLRIIPKSVTLYSRRALYKFEDTYIISIHQYKYELESAFENHPGFVKWIEDKQEHNIEV